MSSSMSFLVLAAICFVGGSSVPLNETELIDKFEADTNQTLWSVIEYFQAVADTADEIKFHEKLTELNNLVLKAEEVKKAEESLKINAKKAVVGLSKLIVKYEEDEQQ
ncbi:hypothetical protein WDU94_000405 [Cyamophila willieti]